MTDMFLQEAGEDEYIVQVHEDKLVKNIYKNIIDECLEHHSCIGDTKQHNQVLLCSILWGVLQTWW